MEKFYSDCKYDDCGGTENVIPPDCLKWKEKEDTINHPNHYTWLPEIECKSVVGHFPYNLGVAIAYIWRCRHKGTFEQDLRKSIKHLEFELERKTSRKNINQGNTILGDTNET